MQELLGFMTIKSYFGGKIRKLFNVYNLGKALDDVLVLSCYSYKI